MPQFIFAYLGGEYPSSPEEGQKHFQKYQQWLTSLGGAVVSPAIPFTNTHTVQADGTTSPGSMPETARRYGVTNRRDPTANLSGGTRYLKDLLERFGNNLELALAGYNAGENAVKKYGNQIPPFIETQSYIRKVIKLYEQYPKESASDT